MKLIKSIIVALVIILSANSVNAQDNFNTKNKNYIVLTRNVEQLKPIILAAKDLKLEDGNKSGVFEVVICGKTIKNLENAELMGPFLKLAKENGVQIIACGFSLNKFKVDRKIISSTIKVVENGILYNFQQQKKGALSIEL